MRLLQNLHFCTLNQPITNYYDTVSKVGDYVALPKDVVGEIYYFEAERSSNDLQNEKPPHANFLFPASQFALMIDEMWLI